MARTPTYPDEFRKDAIELVLSSPQRTVAEIARELGVNQETLRQWVKAERARRAPSGGVAAGALSSEEREELRRLRKRVTELELEKDILRKAAAYFAKEMGR